MFHIPEETLRLSPSTEGFLLFLPAFQREYAYVPSLYEENLRNEGILEVREKRLKKSLAFPSLNNH